MLELWDGTRKSDKHQILTWTYTKPNTRWLVHNWKTFGVRMSHRQIRIHKTHHCLNLWEATTFPLIVYFMSGNGTSTQISFCLGTPKFGVSKFPQIRLPQLWGPITLCANLWLRWGLKTNCSPHQELLNGMLQATWTQGNRDDFGLLVVGSQIGNLTPNPSFGHDFCF